MANTENKTGPKSPRPQSMMARNFALDLDSVFGLGEGEGAAKLQENVEEKKKAVSTQNAELEALQAKLRAMEERLEDIKPGVAARPAPPAPASDEKKQAKKKVEDDSDEDAEDTEEEEEEDEQNDESSDDTSAEENPKRRK